MGNVRRKKRKAGVGRSEGKGVRAAGKGWERRGPG
jgi:hypothetical protein